MPDGTGSATSSDDGTVRVWNHTGTEIATLHALGECTVAFYDDGTFTVTGDPGTRVWWLVKLVRVDDETEASLLGIRRRTPSDGER